jgi:hypothetical protein
MMSASRKPLTALVADEEIEIVALPSESNGATCE